MRFFEIAISKLFQTYAPKMLTAQVVQTKSALVIIAPGSEEMEAVIVIDCLRRANIKVTVASVSSTRIVKCSHGVVIQADCSLASAMNINQAAGFDCLVLPGEWRSSNLQDGRSRARIVKRL
jgi:putative intracellular protease/amidase